MQPYPRKINPSSVLHWPRRLAFTVLALVGLGLFLIFDVSSAEAFRGFQDRYFFVRYQLAWAGIGLVAMLGFYCVPQKWWEKSAPFWYIANLLLLIVVLIPGVGLRLQGSARWIDLGLFVLQPSELMKAVLILYLSAFLAKARSLAQFGLVLGLPLVLVMAEPDLGTTAVMMAIGLTLYYLSGVDQKRIGGLVGIIVLATALFIFTSAYRRNRVLVWLDPQRDPQGISYHMNQIMIALASGGWTGVGLGQSRQKHLYLPEASTDSIFAIAAEEFGLVGSLTMIFLVTYLVFLLLRLAQSCPDRFGRLAASGTAAWFGFQSFFNLGSMVGLVPLTGIPLPFLSYGGSSLIVNMGMVGIMMKIGAKR